MDKKGYIITHTHWDREWRYPIWESRIYLVQMLDELLDVLDSRPEYKSFLFDGQSVFLEDYLMIRPENKERLKKHVSSGRLLIGPWYTLPDLYPVSGESLIRNLLKGDQVCGEYGHKLNIGYESFGWGQPSQFPQIYKGFGIDVVIVAKRVSERRAPESEFLWEGKDGTRILATRLGNDARANFYMNTYLEAMSGRAYKSDEFRYDYGKTRLYHRADTIGSEQDFFMLSHREEVHKARLKELALRSWNAVADSLLENDRILMDGSDSTCAQVKLPELISGINKALEEEGITVSHSSLEDYAALLKEKLSERDLRVIQGELRDGPASSVSANALMTRYPVKKKHKQAEQALMVLAEPLAVAGTMIGLAYDRNYLNRARDYLLGSQSHDSINGVVQEKTVRDVMYRLDQCLELSACVNDQVIRYIAANIDYQGSCDEILLLLVNPLSVSRSEVIELVIDTPAEQNIWALEAAEPDGTKLECITVSRQETVTPVVSRHTRPEPFYADRHELILDTGLIPAGGYKVVKLGARQHFARKEKFWPAARMSDGKELGIAADVMENEYLKVSVQPNGTVKLLDKSTGFLSGELNYLESAGDIGDYWIYFPPYHDQCYTSRGVQADIRMEENTSLQTSICVSYHFRIPAFAMRPEGGIQGESKRSSEMTEVPVQIRYTLKKGSKSLDVTMKIRNTARDHRMTVNFDLGIITDTASAGGHFCVDSRSAKAPDEGNGLRYPEMDKLPMQEFVDLSDGVQGFGVISQEFLEYDASRQGYLSCTLYRSVRNIICTEFRSGSSYPSQEGGQLLEELEYRYALMPHSGNWEQAGVLSESSRQKAPVIPVQFSGDTGPAGRLPIMKSFYEVTGAQVSCIKMGENRDSIILRIYNPAAARTEAVIKFDLPVKEANLTNLKEEIISPVACCRDQIRIELKPDQIVTLEVKM